MTWAKLTEQERLLEARFDPRQRSMFGEEHEAELRQLRAQRIKEIKKDKSS